jgi:WD repeat-containing protein 23
VQNFTSSPCTALFDLQHIPDDPSDGQARVARISGIGFQELSRLLGGAAATFGQVPAQLTAENDDNEDDPDYIDEDEDGDDQEQGYYGRTAPQWFPAVTEPQEAGVKLLMSGEFGRVRKGLESKGNKMSPARLLRDQATKARFSNHQEDITSVVYRPFANYSVIEHVVFQNLVPNTNGTAVASSQANIYSGQFSKGLTFLYIPDLQC